MCNLARMKKKAKCPWDFLKEMQREQNELANKPKCISAKYIKPETYDHIGVNFHDH